MEDFSRDEHLNGDAAIREIDAFLERNGRVHRAFFAIIDVLRECDIPYAVVGGLALVAHGYHRVTVNINILLNPEGLGRLHARLEHPRYARPSVGSRVIKDTVNRVRITFLITGQFPGDGKPKPVAFPDPRPVSVSFDGICYVKLPILVGLKLASGMSNPGRIRDLADVVALIQELDLPLDFQNQLSEYVRPKYDELWQGLQREQPDIG